MDAQDRQDNNWNYKILLILYIHVNLLLTLLRVFVPSCDIRLSYGAAKLRGLSKKMAP